jgi:hypothetical protein
MDYEPFMEMPDTTHMFRTERGSTYAQTPEGQTIRNRSGEKHTDKSTGLQPKSGKTVYMDKNSTNSMAGWLQNADTSTKLVPEFIDGKPTGKANVVLLEDYGPRKAGSVVASGNYVTTPAKGLHPIEIYKSESPVGDRARGIHFGNAITEVLERAPAKPSGGGGSGMVGVPLGRGTNQSGGGGGQPGNLNPMSLQRLMANGGAVRMPKEYSQGGWKLI